MFDHHIKRFTVTFLTRCVKVIVNNKCYMTWKIGINIAKHGDSFQSVIFPAASWKVNQPKLPLPHNLFPVFIPDCFSQISVKKKSMQKGSVKCMDVVVRFNGEYGL